MAEDEEEEGGNTPCVDHGPLNEGGRGKKTTNTDPQRFVENPPFGSEVGFLALDVGAKLVRWCEGGYVFKSHWERKKIR